MENEIITIKSKDEEIREIIEYPKTFNLKEIYEEHFNGVENSNGNYECKFHDSMSKSSLTIDNNKNLWYCFGCQEGGTIYNLISKKYNYDIKKDFYTKIIPKAYEIIDEPLPSIICIDEKELQRIIVIKKTNLLFYNYTKKFLKEVQPYIKNKRKWNDEEIQSLNISYLPSSETQHCKEFLLKHCPEAIDCVEYNKYLERNINIVEHLIHSLKDSIIHAHFFRGDIYTFSKERIDDFYIDKEKVPPKYIKYNIFNIYKKAELYNGDALYDDDKSYIMGAEGFNDSNALKLLNINSYSFPTAHYSNYILKTYSQHLKQFKKIILLPDVEKNGVGLKGALSNAKKLNQHQIKNIHIIQLDRERYCKKMKFINPNFDDKTFIEMQHKLDVEMYLQAFENNEEKKKEVEYLIENATNYYQFLLQDAIKNYPGDDESFNTLIYNFNFLNAQIKEAFMSFAKMHNYRKTEIIEFRKNINKQYKLKQEENMFEELNTIIKQLYEEKHPVSKNEVNKLLEMLLVQGKYNSTRNKLMYAKELFQAFFADCGEKLFFIKTDSDNYEAYYYNEGVYIPYGKSFYEEFARKVRDMHNDKYFNQLVLYDMRAKNQIVHEKLIEISNPYELVVKNGILNILTGELRPHTKEEIHTIKLNIDYDHNAKQPESFAYITEILGSSQQVKLFQEICGSCVCCESLGNKVFIFSGGGANGKSVLIDIISNVLGYENICAIQLHDMDGDQFAISNLKGKLANLVDEVGVKKIENPQILKSLATGNMIQANRKNKDRVMFKNIATIIYSINNQIKSDDTTHAWFRRFMALTFPNTYFPAVEYNEFKKEDKNPHIKLAIENLGKTIFTTPAEKQWFLNWAMKGAQRVIENGGFTQTIENEEFMKQWKNSSNTFLYFMEKHLQVYPGEKVNYNDMMSIYGQFCTKEGLKGTTRRVIESTLSEKGIYINNFQLQGVKLKNIDKFEIEKQTTTIEIKDFK